MRLWSVPRRKNFLFADTALGESASAMIYSVLETVRANGRDVYRYMAVLLAALPNAQTMNEIEALLPWRLTDEALRERFARLPTPRSRSRPATAAIWS